MKDVHVDSSKKKIEIKGWVDNEEELKQAKNYKTICPKCGKKLRQVNALQLCNWFFIYCEDSKCRYSELYIE